MTADIPQRAENLALFEQLYGGPQTDADVAAMRTICPTFVDATIDWAVGALMRRPGLDLKTRELVLLAACVTRGDALLQTAAHAQAALRVGATCDEVRETILQLLFYAGGPAVRAGLTTVAALLTEARP